MNNLDLNATIVLPLPIYVFNSHIEADFYSQEFNLLSPDDQPFRWTLGLFWQKQDSHLLDWPQGGFNFIGVPVVGFPLVPALTSRGPPAHGTTRRRTRPSSRTADIASTTSGNSRPASDTANMTGTSSPCGSTTCSIPKGAWCRRQRPGPEPRDRRPTEHLREFHRLAGRAELRSQPGHVPLRTRLQGSCQRRHQYLSAVRRLRRNGSDQLRGRMEAALGRRPVQHAIQRLLRDLRRLPGELCRDRHSGSTTRRTETPRRRAK